MKLEHTQCVIWITKLRRAKFHEQVWSPYRRRHHAVDVRRELSTERRVDQRFIKVYVRGGRISLKHLFPIKRELTSSKKCIATLIELVGRKVVGVGPDAIVRVIIKLVIGHDEVIEEVLSGWIARF